MTLTVSDCCCGCSLPSGTKHIAVFLLVCSILLTVHSSVMLGYLNSGMDHHGQPLGMYNMLLLKSEEGLRVAYVFGIVAGILQAILNTLLLFGVHKENKILVSIWLAAYFVIFVQSVLLLVVSFFQYLPNPYYQVGAVIDIGLTMYFLLVVRSYRHSLADGHNRQQNAANLYYTENSNIKRMPLA